MLSVEVLTLFPRMVKAPLEESILGKAQQAGLVRVTVTDIREYAEGRHRVTDDVPYGGGAGMVMKPEPLVAAIEDAKKREPSGRVVLLSPQGRRFTQAIAQEYAARPLILVCGRYEGVDERVLRWIDEELSLGDFVLTGGEVAALAVVEAVARLEPGVLGNADSPRHESFGAAGLLEGPQYTRPAEFRGLKVPDVLLSGDHARIAQWRHEQALSRTRERRPDLLSQKA
ncbi:MAG TPA: tRNA (guanosine(37)-N1)-methyltransferase TrmD [Myxococcales bacterium]|nr:tRNA (guanosine(37)-N1)-methyltransferase TrmD [Myxococcales bacterium]